MPEAYGRGVAFFEFEGAAGGSPPPPPPPPPPPASRLDWMFFAARNQARGYEGFGGGVAPPPPPSAPTITVRLVDAAASGSALPSLTGIQWGWWDSATDLSGTFGVSPTNSGTAESTDGSGNLVLSASSSTKTSGQQAFVMLHVTGSNPRTFGALLPVD